MLFGVGAGGGVIPSTQLLNTELVGLSGVLGGRGLGGAPPIGGDGGSGKKAAEALEAVSRKTDLWYTSINRVLPQARQLVDVQGELERATWLSSTAIEAQIGLIPTVGSQVGDVGAAVADNTSKWFQWKDLATGAIGAVASQIGGLTGQLMNIGQQLLSGNWVGAIMGGVGLLVGKIRGMFGASKEELQGREDYEEFSSRMRQEFAGNQRYVEEVSRAMALGQSESIAHAKAAFQVVAEASGRAWDEGSRLHDQYLNAIDSGNLQLMAQAEATFLKWREEAGLANESMTADFDKFFQNVTAEQAPKLTEAMIAMFEKGIDAAQRFANATDRLHAAHPGRSTPSRSPSSRRSCATPTWIAGPLLFLSHWLWAGWSVGGLRAAGRSAYTPPLDRRCGSRGGSPAELAEPGRSARPHHPRRAVVNLSCWWSMTSRRRLHRRLPAPDAISRERRPSWTWRTGCAGPRCGVHVGKEYYGKVCQVVSGVFLRAVE